MRGEANRMSVFDAWPPELQRTMTDVLALPDEARTLVIWLLRQGEASLSQVAAFVEQDENSTRTLLADLIEQGFVQILDKGEEPHYRVRLVSRRGSQLPHDL